MLTSLGSWKTTFSCSVSIVRSLILIVIVVLYNLAFSYCWHLWVPEKHCGAVLCRWSEAESWLLLFITSCSAIADISGFLNNNVELFCVDSQKLNPDCYCLLPLVQLLLTSLGTWTTTWSCSVSIVRSLSLIVTGIVCNLLFSNCWHLWAPEQQRGAVLCQ